MVIFNSYVKLPEGKCIHMALFNGHDVMPVTTIHQDSTIPARGHGQAQKGWDRSRRTAALTAAATALGLGLGGRARARQAAGGGTDRGVLPGVIDR